MLCSEEQKQKAESATATVMFEVDAEPISSEVEACNDDAGCSDGDGDQGCFPYFIKLDESGNNWDAGRGCFESDLKEICKATEGENFQLMNTKYGESGYEYSIDLSCELTNWSGASQLAASFLVAVFTLSMF